MRKLPRWGGAVAVDDGGHGEHVAQRRGQAGPALAAVDDPAVRRALGGGAGQAAPAGAAQVGLAVDLIDQGAVGDDVLADAGEVSAGQMPVSPRRPRTVRCMLAARAVEPQARAIRSWARAYSRRWRRDRPAPGGSSAPGSRPRAARGSSRRGRHSRGRPPRRGRRWARPANRRGRRILPGALFSDSPCWLVTPCVFPSSPALLPARALRGGGIHVMLLRELAHDGGW